jgi:hypothetical protein
MMVPDSHLEDERPSSANWNRMLGFPALLTACACDVAGVVGNKAARIERMVFIIFPILIGPRSLKPCFHLPILAPDAAALVLPVIRRMNSTSSARYGLPSG